MLTGGKATISRYELPVVFQDIIQLLHLSYFWEVLVCLFFFNGILHASFIVFSLCCDKPAEDHSFVQRNFPRETSTWFVGREGLRNAWWEGACGTARKLILPSYSWSVPTGFGKKGQTNSQSSIIIKVACGDDLIGLSFQLSFCEMPNNHQLVCMPFFFNRNLFWNGLNRLKFKEGHIRIPYLFVRAGWLSQGSFCAEMMTRQNKCDSSPFLMLWILSTGAHTLFSFKCLDISLIP